MRRNIFLFKTNSSAGCIDVFLDTSEIDRSFEPIKEIWSSFKFFLCSIFMTSTTPKVSYECLVFNTFISSHKNWCVVEKKIPTDCSRYN